MTHHRAYRRWHHAESTNPLRSSVSRQRQSTCNLLRGHSHQGRPRQRHVLLFFGGLAHERVSRDSASIRRHLHGDKRPRRLRSIETNHNTHQGRQPRFNYAHQRDAH